MRRHRAPISRTSSLAALMADTSDTGLPLERVRKMNSIPDKRFRNVHLQVDSGRRQAPQIDVGFYQSPLDGRCVHH